MLLTALPREHMREEQKSQAVHTRKSKKVQHPAQNPSGTTREKPKVRGQSPAVVSLGALQPKAR